MAIRVRNSQKPFIEVQWSVAIPRAGCRTDSEWFSARDNKWKLRLTVCWSNSMEDESWTMDLLRAEKKIISTKFPISVYVQDNDRNHFLSNITTTSSSATLWTCSSRSFSSAYPGIQVAGNTLMFIIAFDVETLSSKIPSRENKLVQTSVPNVSRSHSDDRACLEGLSQSLGELMDEGSDSDVQLKCGDCSIGAHKLILGARSEVFRAMLQSDMLEGREGTIEISDMEPRVFEIFIRYIYTGILPDLNVDIASPLYEAGDKYQIKALKERSSSFLTKNLNRENAFKILVMADAHSDKDLKDQVVPYILDEKLPSSDEWSELCNDYPKLANEVLNRAYKLSSCNQ